MNNFRAQNLKIQFRDEDRRKDSLFEAWNSYFDRIHSRLSERKDFEFDEIYEGLAHVAEVDKNSMTVRLEDRNSLCRFEITEKIGLQSATKDLIYIILGKAARVWVPLDIISIGSLIAGKESGFHLTINPLHMKTQALH